MSTQTTSVNVRIETYDSFEMFSKEGDAACKNLVKKVFEAIDGGHLTTKDEVTKMIHEECLKIEINHREVYDTEPTYHIQKLVNFKLKEAGYSFEVNRYDF
jgi:hypothetical protein